MTFDAAVAQLKDLGFIPVEGNSTRQGELWVQGTMFISLFHGKEVSTNAIAHARRYALERSIAGLIVQGE